MIDNQIISAYSENIFNRLINNLALSGDHSISQVSFYDDQLANLDKKFKDQLKQQICKSYEWLCQYIQDCGNQNYLKARQSQGFLIDSSLKDNQLVWTSSGQVYFKVGELGHGSFKTTFKTVLVASLQFSKKKEHLKYRALSINTHPIKEEEWVEFENERLINCYLKEESKTFDLSHVNVPKSISKANHQYFALTMEVFDGTIENIITEKKVSWKNRLSLASQMAKAVAQLHEIQIIHRDIKLDNFLYRFDPHLESYFVKITDFGVSSKINIKERSTNKKFFQYITEPCWHLYEFPYRRFELSSDLYQLGIALFQVFTGTSLSQWKEMQKQDILFPLTDSCEERPDISGSFYKWKCYPQKWKRMDKIKHPEIKNYIMALLNLAAHKRPSAQLVHEFFEKIISEIKSDFQQVTKWEYVDDANLKLDSDLTASLGEYTELTI